MTIEHGSTTTGTDTNNNPTLTISNHTVTGTNPVLIVKAAAKGTAVLGITWNTTEDLVELNIDENGDAMAALWYLASPSATTADIVVTLDGNSMRKAGAASTYIGVDQNTPFRVAGANSANGSTGNPTVVITALADEMVVDSMCQVSAGPDTASASDTERHNIAATGGGTDTRGCSQEKASSGAEETLIWTMSDNDNWAICAGPLQEPLPPSLGVHPDHLIVHSL